PGGAVAALADHVPVVIGSRPDPQMRRVHARWVVATVEDTHALGDRAVVVLPHGAVRQFVPVLDSTAPADDAVAEVRRGTLPLPASTRGLDHPPHDAFVDGGDARGGRGIAALVPAHVV